MLKIYLTATHYNMLKNSGLITAADKGYGDFVGFRDGRGISQPTPVVVLPVTQMPGGLEMILTHKEFPDA